MQTLAQMKKALGNTTESNSMKGETIQNSFKGYDPETGRGIYQSAFPIGTPRTQKGARILELVQNVWSHKPITLTVEKGGIARTIEAKFDPYYDATENNLGDASKLMGGNRHGTGKDKRVTLDLGEDYYQLLEESHYNRSKDEEGKDTFAHQEVFDWHYFINDILFQEYGSEGTAPYRVSINIKERPDGTFVYSYSAELQTEEAVEANKKRASTQRTLHAAVNQPNYGEANAQPSGSYNTQNQTVVNTPVPQNPMTAALQKAGLVDEDGKPKSLKLSPEAIKQNVDMAVNHFGTTNRINEAGHLTAGGRFSANKNGIRIIGCRNFVWLSRLRRAAEPDGGRA